MRPIQAPIGTVALNLGVHPRLRRDKAQSVCVFVCEKLGAGRARRPSLLREPSFSGPGVTTRQGAGEQFKDGMALARSRLVLGAKTSPGDTGSFLSRAAELKSVKNTHTHTHTGDVRFSQLNVRWRETRRLTPHNSADPR